MEVAGSLAVQLKDPPTVKSRSAGGISLGSENGDPDALGKRFDRILKIHIFDPLHKGDGIATRTATKAVKAVILWIYAKGRRLFAVERTKPLQKPAGTLERNVRRDDPLDIRAGQHLFHNAFLNHTVGFLQTLGINSSR